MMHGSAWIADYPDGDNFMQLLYGPNTGQSNSALLPVARSSTSSTRNRGVCPTDRSGTSSTARWRALMEARDRLDTRATAATATPCSSRA